MTTITTITSTVTASFLGSFVEAVEAFTIVLAVGVSQNWRSALQGAGLALAVLAALIVGLGPLLGLIPITILQYAVGTLLALFGIRWLRKAILRAAGYIPLHDEAKSFAKETDLLKRQAGDRRADFLAALASFKAVLLEGLEVVFIVIAVGAGHGMLPYAGIGAAAACLVVLAIGLAVHRPLAQVPENSLKFAVGVLLTSFGIFWIGEGLGTPWPGGDLAIPAIMAFLLLLSLVAVRVLRGTRATAYEVDAP
jgi:uncharacterized membrane protein